MNDLPPVSCMCLTYGRPQLLEEAIQSFLLQNYSGPKELVVLNDFDKQTLEFVHPEVVVINVPRRFHSLGEKRNACAALCSHDILFVWDDDDIFLPHRLTYSVRMFEPTKGYFKSSKGFVLNNGALSGPNMNIYHSASCFSRILFNEAHGYRHMGSGQDLDLELAFESMIGKDKNYKDASLDEIYYLYRWAGTGSYHLSGFGKDNPSGETGNKKVERYVQQQVNRQVLSVGNVKLEPHWSVDYVSLVLQYISTGTLKDERTENE